MNRRLRSLTAFAAGIVLITGCLADDTDDTGGTGGPAAPPAVDERPLPGSGAPVGGFGMSRLGFFADCEDLLAYLRTEALARVTPWGLGSMFRFGPGAEDAIPEQAPAADAGGSDDEGSSAPVPGVDYSDTNVQEVGVDEGDVVETDGRVVYVAAPDGVRAVDVATAGVVGVLDVPEGDHELLLDGDRLLVVTRVWSGGATTVVSLFDVGVPERSELLQRRHLEGSLVASRAADGIARLVLTSPLATRLPFVSPDLFGYDEARALAENQRIIREAPIEDWLPRWFGEGVDGEFGAMAPAIDCSTVAAPEVFAGLGISWIASIDLDGAAPQGDVPGSAGVVSMGETVYATATSLYLATVPWDWFHPIEPIAGDTGIENTGIDDTGISPAAPDSPPPTLIHQFSLDADGGASHRASGEVAGYLLDQFSMSEHDGVLRVATTVEDWTGERPSESFVRALRRDGPRLVEIGAIGGLGLTERIFAVRFLGPRAAIVTFRQTDPLYLIDLTDPSAPRLTGELKIPGYSAYLHPIGDDRLLGIGQAATDDGVVLGTQMSLFDISDPAAPQQLSTLFIGGWSDAEWDHRAFLYWPADGTVVIPVSPWWSGCPMGEDCLVGDEAALAGTSGGAAVARVVGDELQPVGVIRHEQMSSCWNPLQRAIVIGSELVTVGLDRVQFQDRATLGQRGAAQWADPERYGCVWFGD